MQHTTLRVRYGETDQMGVVYHSNYLRYFEVARADFLRQIGYSYKRFEDEGFMLPVTSCHCYFKSPAKYDDELDIQVRIKTFNGVRLVLSYHIYRITSEEKLLLVEGETAHVISDKALKPLNIKKYNPDFYILINQLSTS